MVPKLQWLNAENAAAFEDQGVAEAYNHRASYPAETIDFLLGLIAGDVRTVLDVGAGTGDLARPLSVWVEVDAVDVSAAMIAVGKTLEHGDNPRLRWIHGRIEDTALAPPYGLVTAGQSLHWMDWDVVMPLFRSVLVPGGVVAITDVAGASEDPWSAAVGGLIRRFSVIQNFQAYDLVTELEGRNLFRRIGTRRTAPVPYTPTVEQFIESFHGRSSLSRARLGDAQARAFDAEMRGVLEPHARDGRLHSLIVGVVDWGEPAPTGT
jgi:SAM-dependent methyltransferase